MFVRPLVALSALVAPRHAPVVQRITSGEPELHNFLLQRSVQTQLQYYRDFKNDFAFSWLARFAEKQGCEPLCNSNGRGGVLLHRHDAMRDVAWDGFLRDMMRAPAETHVVHMVWGYRGGGSPNNPYLSKEPKTRTYTDTVKPGQIAQQIMVVREVLAEECTADLRLVLLDNAELRRHHTEEVKHVYDKQENEQHVICPDEAPARGEGLSSSPLRGSTYDLLKNAVTQHALRLLGREVRDETHVAEWLQLFVETHGGRFRGDVEWGAAKDVVKLMMVQPVSVSSLGGKARFIDPVALSERLMELRAEAAADWAKSLGDVPAAHLRLARERLEQRLRAGRNYPQTLASPPPDAQP